MQQTPADSLCEGRKESHANAQCRLQHQEAMQADQHSRLTTSRVNTGQQSGLPPTPNIVACFACWGSRSSGAFTAVDVLHTYLPCG